MPPPNSPQPPQAVAFTPQTWLRMSFLIWGALLVGQIVFFGVVLFLQSNGRRPAASEQTARLFLFVDAALLIVAGAGTYVLRRTIFTRARDKEEKVRLGMMFSGNLLFWAACEGASLFGIVCFMMSGKWQNLISSAAAIVLQLLHPPRLPSDSIFPDASQPGVRRP